MRGDRMRHDSTDELVFSGGGSIAVATDALLVAVAHLRRFAAAVEGTRSTLAALSAQPGPESCDSAADLTSAERGLAESAERAHRLAAALEQAAENYGELERRVRRLSRGAPAWMADRLGRLLPLAAILVPHLLGIGAAGVRAAGEDRQLLTDPRTVGLIRSAVMGSDDFAAAVAGLPPGLAALLGEDGLRLVGVSGVAALLTVSAAQAGALREGAVRVREFGRRRGSAPPSGFGERAARLPTGRSQIRIERYTFAGRPDRFEVFLGGTRTPTVVGGDEPWDMTSNLHAVADRSPGSLRAAAAAMRQAGVTAESEVVFTGYSQGGLLAGMLAASGDYNTQGLVTFGAPAGIIEIPDAFPAVMLEHTDDLVPALGGDRTDLTPIVVRRQAFAGREVPEDIAVPAHELAEYRSTAELLDTARSPGITAAAERLRTFGSGAERIDVMFYRAERVPGG
jgi:hypothetical protein